MEWREGKEKFERGHAGDDQLLKGTQKCDIFFKGTQVKASYFVVNIPASHLQSETDKQACLSHATPKQKGSTPVGRYFFRASESKRKRERDTLPTLLCYLETRRTTGKGTKKMFHGRSTSNKQRVQSFGRSRMTEDERVPSSAIWLSLSFHLGQRPLPPFSRPLLWYRPRSGGPLSSPAAGALPPSLSR
jgi:hypothetical protein